MSGSRGKTTRMLRKSTFAGRAPVASSVLREPSAFGEQSRGGESSELRGVEAMDGMDDFPFGASASGVRMPRDYSTDVLIQQEVSSINWGGAEILELRL